MSETEETIEVVWEPLPGSQLLAVSAPCNEILYDGSRGPGKTDAQLMRFRSLVGKGYGKFLRGIIFDREYKNLDDMIAKSEKHFYAFKDGARFLRSKGDYCWTWPTGEVLYFRQIKREADYMKFHGQEFPWLAWNELTKYPNRKLYDLMLSCNRSGFIPEKHTPRNADGAYMTDDGLPLPELPLQIFATTNPWGPGHSWVKKQFIDGIDPGEVVRKTTNVFNPRTKKRENITRTQVRLFGTYKENSYLSPEYIATLESETDPERRKAWLLGDWNIRAGGMFNDVWEESIHVVPDFEIPKDWYIDRAFDWGSSHPFSVGWYAIANGETVTCYNGAKFSPRRGSIIRFEEWYGTSGAVNDGLRMSSPDIAAGIMRREMEFLKKGLIKKVPNDGPADGQIYQVAQSDVATIGEKMAAEGIGWKPADKSKGSRKNGWQLIRDALANSKKGEGAGLYFTKRCKHAIGFIQDTPRSEEDPDDVDTEAEDHLQDELRYRMLDASRKVTQSFKTTHAK
jgi:hypothetical protein